MARGNFSSYGAKYKPRCRLCCRIVLKKDMVRLNGVNPAHKACADERGIEYTLALVPRAAQAAKQTP